MLFRSKRGWQTIDEAVIKTIDDGRRELALGDGVQANYDWLVLLSIVTAYYDPVDDEAKAWIAELSISEVDRARHLPIGGKFDED